MTVTSYKVLFERLRDEISDQKHTCPSEDVCLVCYLEDYVRGLEAEAEQVVSPENTSFVHSNLAYAAEEYCCVGSAPRVVRAVGRALTKMFEEDR